ncbi:MAG: family N-acetyltransferase [Aeromicrobium sp.]|uniref:GNAT family N-acetyltransferase n=1 Tax=Aeromicrobium sp. TaxID=1871063 RepID=UPI00262BC30D|nr:GNAT family N-acetyltransferase [Aeromicrobium sp.]MCW2824386.1 family N-acetyltransferase [Aeromicrobium sp.]
MILEPMTAERFGPWNDQLVLSYAREKVESGSWLEDGAVARSCREQAELLPDGVDTDGHDLFVGTVDGVEVGVLWLFTDPDLTVPETYIYDIEVRADHRGRGLGRELLEAAEGWCADHSIGVLRLHVFAHNETAIGLYETSGFGTTSHTMAKTIR